MLEKLRNRLLAFIESDKDAPLLAGFAVGFYMMLFYYSRNFALANSWQQLLFFVGYYLVLPALALFAGYKLLPALKLSKYRKNFLFVGTIGFFAFFILQLSTLNETKRYIFAGVLLAAVLLSIKFGRYYKAFIPILFIVSLFNIKPIAGGAYKFITSSDEWKKLPDDIESVKFKSKPNVYYIQPDGYTSFATLKNSIHRFDNSDYENFLKNNGFTLYEDFRSNYYSTLLSNSATFAMKHHYIASDVEFYGARKIITEDNPVLRIFRNNGYRSSFITERPYLLINRPDPGFDYCNIKNDQLPYIKDGLNMDEDVFADLKVRMNKNGLSGNFYFIESFTPSHITNTEGNSAGVKGERDIYLNDIRDANRWLKEIIAYISNNDPEGIIIIGADHGGFAGLSSTSKSAVKITDRDQVYSIFGAQLSIKWGNPESGEYDKGLKTPINLFRTLFSFLGREKKYLQHTEDNSSYIKLKNPAGLYKYIDNSGNVVFEQQ